MWKKYVFIFSFTCTLTSEMTIMNIIRDLTLIIMSRIESLIEFRDE